MLLSDVEIEEISPDFITPDEFHCYGYSKASTVCSGGAVTDKPAVAPKTTAHHGQAFYEASVQTKTPLVNAYRCEYGCSYLEV